MEKEKKSYNLVIGIVALIVDDEEDIRELIELSLVRMGLGVDAAGSVKEAIRLVSERQYRLCLTDMRLPDGDGLDIVRHIGEAYAHPLIHRDNLVLR